MNEEKAPSAGTTTGRMQDERAADAIVHQLEAMIVGSRLPDGDPIPIERDLMDQEGASRQSSKMIPIRRSVGSGRTRASPGNR